MSKKVKQNLLSLNILKKAFKQYSALSSDSFKVHQNDLIMLNSPFLEGLDKDLVAD